MTYTTHLNSATSWTGDATLIVEGVPFVFGTRAGLSIGTADTPALDIINPETNPLVSVAAIVPGSISLGKSSLDIDRGWVGPREAQMRIVSDPQWDKFFERRRTPITRLSVLASHNTGTLLVGSSTGISTGDIVYVDNEAMKVTGTTATTINVTRNYQTLTVTRPTSHRAGSLVSVAPRNLLGRACEFRLWLGGGIDNEKQEPLYLSSSPQYNRDEGTWDFSFNSAIKHFDRKCHVGFRGSSVTGFVNNETTLEMVIEDPNEFASVSTNGDLLCDLVDVDYLGRRHVIVPISSISGSNVVISRVNWSSNETTVIKHVRRVYDLSRSPLFAALTCMLSDRGDGVNNATYDTMFGRTSSGTNSTNRLAEGEQEMRFGAAVPAELVDIASIEALEETVAGWNMVIGADGKEIGLLEILEECAFAVGGFWAFEDGKLTIKIHDGNYAGDTFDAALTESDISRDSPLNSVDDETDVVHTINLACNYGRGAVFYADVVSYYLEEKETWRDIRGDRSFKRKMLLVEVPELDRQYLWLGNNATFITLDELRNRLDRYFARRSNGLRKYQLVLPWRFSQLEPGDRVRITHPQLNDFAGSTLSSFACVIHSVARDFSNGRVTIDVAEVPKARYIGPTAVVQSWDGGLNRATLDTSTKYMSGANPGEFFAGGWDARILDASATPRFSAVSTSTNILTVTASTIEFVGAPSITPAAGDLIVLSEFDGHDSTNTNVAQTALFDDYAFMGTGVATTLGVALEDPHLWG